MTFLGIISRASPLPPARLVQTGDFPSVFKSVLTFCKICFNKPLCKRHLLCVQLGISLPRAVGTLGAGREASGRAAAPCQPPGTGGLGTTSTIKGSPGQSSKPRIWLLLADALCCSASGRAWHNKYFRTEIITDGAYGGSTKPKAVYRLLQFVS